MKVINWNGTKGGLVATCYLQAYSGRISNIPIESIHSMKDSITNSMMVNLKKRYPITGLISSEPIFIDGLPAIYLIREAHGKSFDTELNLKTWTIITVWDEQEISFECVSSIPFQFPDNPVVAKVENQIMKVLRTLHFER